MPLHHLLENALSILLNNVTMTRHNLIEIPAIDPRNTLIKRRAIPAANRIPNEPLLPLGIARSRVDRTEQPRQPPTCRALPRLTHLLCRGQIEHQIRFDQRARGPVVED